MPTLQGFDVDHFLQHHWQKKPLLIRGAFPGFEGFFDLEDLAALCQGEQTPSRFVSPRAGLVHGPLEIDVDGLAERGWTLLVQSLETVSAEAWDLLDAFSFLPRARLDDLMVSYAAPGGGVGPHFDLYDVFLVQGFGQRRWRYAAGPLVGVDDELASSARYDFEPDHDEVLGPGDVLYLPPRVPHDGEAVTACTTYSVGGAAPRHADLTAEFLAFLSSDPELAGLETTGIYSDPAPSRPNRRAGVPERLQEETLALMSRLTVSPGAVSTFLGRLLSAPKLHTEYPEGEEVDAAEMAARLTRPGRLRLTPPTRMLHDGRAQIFINGLAYEADDPEALLDLADARQLVLPRPASEEVVEMLAEWIEAGFVTWEDEAAD